MKKANNVIFPLTDAELTSIRKHPGKMMKFPAYSEQKTGIKIYSFVFLFVIVVFLTGIALKNYLLTIYPLIFLPMLHTNNVLNLFGITDEGILSGIRFVSWKKIKSFEFVRIGVNHKYYGHSKEVNDTYELKLKGKFIPISYIVTTKEMKHKLTNVLNDYVITKQPNNSFHEG